MFKYSIEQVVMELDPILMEKERDSYLFYEIKHYIQVLTIGFDPLLIGRIKLC